MIRLLGDLRVERGGVSLALPASKKTRALLGYLVATGSRHTREHLCDLLWDRPDDPRAALRWSLSKLRPLINARSAARLVADRATVAFQSAGAGTDLAQLAALRVGVAAETGLDALAEAASLLKGEFLAGLDLPRCYRFQSWLIAERQRYGRERREVLEALIARLIERPLEALPYAHALVAVDPLSEPAHALLVRLLVESRQLREAEVHYQYARDLLRRELSAPLTGTLQPPARIFGAAWQDVPAAQPAGPAPLAEVDARSREAPFAGRIAERRTLQSAIETFAAGTRHARLLLLTGEPGIGKTRLLGLAGELADAAGMRVAGARCFEAEMIRPYGIWSDMRQGGAGLPSLMQPPVSAGLDRDELRAKLFDDVARDLVSWAGDASLLVLIDDMQWIAEGSAALLHYLVRRADLPVLFIAAARAGGLGDNPWARRLVASLEGERRLETQRLRPLEREDLALLAGSALSAQELESVHRASGGNPLFALNLLHARTAGAGAGIEGFRRLVEQRLTWLDDTSREIMQCAAAVGRPFDAGLLASSLERAEIEIDRNLEHLEQHGVLVALPDGRYDFAHDLVREAIYSHLSQARRLLLHRRLARTLSVAAASDDRLAGELARHAALAEQHLDAAQACVVVGERCLSAFADRDAAAAAELGLAQSESIARPGDRARLRVSLLTIKLYASAGTDHPIAPALTAELARAIDDAENLAEGAVARIGAVALAWANHRANQLDRTRLAILHAEAISRTIDDATHCQQLASTGRCLLDIEADIAEARSFLTRAEEMADRLGIAAVELDWGKGLLARWDGDLDAARAALVRAADAVCLREGGWREFECLVWLAKLGLERGSPAETIAACDRIAAVTGHPDRAEHPVAAALRALTDLQALPSSESLERLRAYDDKTNLAYVLDCCASRALDGGDREHAQTYAAAALAAARAVNQPTETVVATVLLLRCASAGSQRLPPASMSMLGQGALSARARRFLDQAVKMKAGTFQRSLQRRSTYASSS